LPFVRPQFVSSEKHQKAHPHSVNQANNYIITNHALFLCLPFQGNDDDIGALGSILSWDDDEDHAARTSDPDVAAALAGKSNSGGGTSALPPGLVSFALGNNNTNAANDVQSYFNQFNLGNLLNGNNSGSCNNNNNNSGVGNPTPTPDPTACLPGMNFGQQNQPQQQNPAMNNVSVTGTVNGQQQQQQPPLVQGGQGNQQMLPQNFALFQQNGMLMQQQQQQQNNGKQQPQQQQQTLAPAMNGMVMPQVGQQQGQQQQAQPQQQQVQQQQVQQQQVPQQQQQMQQMQQQQQVPQQVQQQQVQQQLQQHAAQQFSITGDANAFLRQLQVAQIQQQFNALQQQQQQQQQQQGAIAQSSINTAQQQAVLQQQLQQLQRSQLPLVAVQPGQQQQPQQAPSVQQVQQTQVQPQEQPTASASTPMVAPATAPTQGLPPKPKAAAKASPAKKSAGSRKKAPPVTSASIVVSASDTEGELSSRAAKNGAKRSGGGGAESASKKRKPPEPIDTSNMTPQEKAKANRDRNREHARNTRLRKKAYLEKLKGTVDELCKERDTLVSERAGAANLLVEMHNTRTEVLMSFFALRSTNEKRRKLWATILDESCFACVMPVTPYRSFPASEVQVSKCQRTVLGIDGMMADTASLHVLLSSLVDRSKFPYGKIEFCYTLVTEEAVVAGNQMMARWVMSTLNATKLGARMEVSKQGMLCCKFNSAHRITGLELMFDVMALMLQLKQAAGSESFSVIPNTLQTCQRSFDKPMVMTLAESPYTIVQVNQLWENMTGYAAEEVVGKSSCSILQGQDTDKNGLQELMNEVRFKRAASSMLVNYTKGGEQFRNCIVVFPLSTDSRITHYLALSTYVERLRSDGSAVASAITTAVVPQPAASVTSSSGFSTANASAAGQMHQMLQSQAQALQGNNNAAAQHQAALANNASAAAMLAQNSIVATSAPGQMLPPSCNTVNIQQQQFAVQSVPQQQQQAGVANGGTPHAQV